MYLLEVNHGGGEIHHYFLLPGESYEVGRKECRLLLPGGEPSISRHHATIVVSALQKFAVFDPKSHLEVCIQDFSKHGTFVDKERIGKDNSRFVYPEDRIRFGIKVTARLVPVTLVLAVSPDMPVEALEEVIECAVQLGAFVTEERVPPPEEYYDKHTNCLGFLYVAPDKFTMDQSMMEALGYGYTLVTTTYLTSLVKDLKSNDTLMPTEFPSPLPPTPASLALRNTHYRRPVQTFYSASEFLSVGSPASSSVFTGFRFLMLDPAIASIYEGIIQSFKGTVEVVKNASEVKTSGDKHTVVLLSESDFNTVSDIVLCNMADAHKASDIVQSYISLYKKQYCLIPEENVHLALYRDDPKEIYEKTNACYLQSSETVVEEKEAPKPSPEKKSNLPERKSTEVRKHERAEPAEAPTPEPVNAAPKETSAVEPRRSSSHEVKVTPAAAKEDSGKGEPPKSRLPAKSRLAPRIPAGQEPLETPNNLNDYYNNLDEKSPSVSDDEVEAPRGSRDHVDEKRPVVVHAAEQVKSSPRQRVDAVKVSSEARSNRRASVSKEPEIQHHVDPEKQGSQKRAKRQIIRRESVSVRGSASVTRRASASVSYQRQDSLRSKETPLRTTTPRVSNSVPRNRPGTGGHPAAPTSTRNRSPKARPFSPNKDDEKPHTSARRRRSSSTSASPSTSMTNPGQIPGLRANSLSTAEGAAADAALGQKCVEFTRSFLDNFMTDVEKKTRMIVRQTFVDSSSQRFLEEGIQDLHQFLQQMTQTEQEIPPLYSSEETRRNCYDVRQKATYILRKIKGTYDSVKTKPPPSLLKARDALSARPTSPKKNNRYASLSSESARRSGGNKESSSEAK